MIIFRRIASLISVAATAVLFNASIAAADMDDCTATTGEACLRITFVTGGDDLRGGGDDLSLWIHSRSRGLRLVSNVNQGASWGNNSSHKIGINLRRLYGADIPASDITTIGLSPILLARNIFEGTDNWDLNSVAVLHEFSGSAPTTLRQASQLTPHRFTIYDPTADLRIDDVLNGGFEWNSRSSIQFPWFTEGRDAKGLDIGRGRARTGSANNAWISTASRDWNAILQTIPVDPKRNYVLRGWIRTSGHGDGADVNTAFFGVRMSGMWPPTEQHFGPSPAGQYQEIIQPFNPGNRTSVTVFCGFWGLGTDGWIRIDDISVLPA